MLIPPLSLTHLHQGLLWQLGGFEGDEAVQAGRGRAVGDVAQAAGALRRGEATHGAAWGGRAHRHAGGGAHVHPPAGGGAQGTCRAVGAHWRGGRERKRKTEA